MTEFEKDIKKGAREVEETAKEEWRKSDGITDTDDAIIGRAVAFQALLGIVLLFAFPFATNSSGHRATWFFVSGPATAILWLSALGHAVWFTWRKARGH